MLAILAFCCFAAAVVVSFTRWARFAISLIAAGLAFLTLAGIGVNLDD